MTHTETILISIIPLILTTLGFLGRYLVNRIRTQWAQNVLRRLGHLAELIVLDVYRTYTEMIKLGRADGTLTIDERKEARSKALTKLEEHLSFETLGKALGILDLGGDPKLHAATVLERAYVGLQSLGIVPRSSVNP